MNEKCEQWKSCCRHGVDFFRRRFRQGSVAGLQTCKESERRGGIVDRLPQWPKANHGERRPRRGQEMRAARHESGGLLADRHGSEVRDTCREALSAGIIFTSETRVHFHSPILCWRSNLK